jgi:hypothetical protein
MKKLGVVFLFLVTFLTVSASAETSLSGPADAELLGRANELFRQANELYGTDPDTARELYKKSLLRFEKLANDGVKNGKLFYNIGNVYFRLNDLGRAILNYRRAELYIPDNANLQRNLAYALSRRVDRIDVKQEEKVLKTLFFWHYDLPLTVRSGVFAIFYVSFWLFAGWRFFRSGPLTNWGLGISLLLSSFFLGSLLTDRFAQAGNVTGVLVESEVIARKGDGMSYQPSFKAPLHAGADFLLRIPLFVITYNTW